MRYPGGVWYMSQRTSVYLDDGLQAAAKASGVPSPNWSAAAWPPAPRPPRSPQWKTWFHHLFPSGLPNGDPCPGVACAGHGCWNRDTARYGLRRLVLCRACVAALQGDTYKRKAPPGAARATRCGTTA